MSNNHTLYYSFLRDYIHYIPVDKFTHCKMNYIHKSYEYSGISKLYGLCKLSLVAYFMETFPIKSFQQYFFFVAAVTHYTSTIVINYNS